jgi:transcriptional regulator CtsR
MKKILLFTIFLSFYGFSIKGSDLFPEISEWKMREEDRVYNSGDLWEIINGAAEGFLSYYFEDLHIAEYTNGDRIIRVELYKHKTIEDAYGIYAAERMPDYLLIPVGSQGYKSTDIINFVAGNYYIKIMKIGTAKVEESTLMIIAEAVNKQLKQPVGLPDAIRLFPEEGMTYLSDNYIAQDFLGYSFFRAAYTARYDKPVSFQLFIIKLTPDEIQKMLDQYFSMLKEDKVQQKEGIYIVNDLFNGKILMKQLGSFLIGVYNTDNEDVAIGYIQKTIARLP